MHVTFYNNSKIKTSSTLSKIGKAELFLDYLDSFITYLHTKKKPSFDVKAFFFFLANKEKYYKWF